MNRPVMIRNSGFLRALGLGAALACGACSGPDQPSLSEAPLAGARLGGDFTLTGEDGRPVRWRDFDGQWRIIYFGYAFCPDICPTDMQRAMAGLKAFEAAEPALGARVQPLFVSVDPERDTPEVLREFTGNFHPRLIGLTGDVATLEQVAKAFGTTFSRGETRPGGGYLMNHYGYTYLFGPDGQPVAMLPTDQGPEAVEQELARWVR